jgi:epoxyqueuosine reductase
MIPTERTQWVCERARSLGFELCGVAPVEDFAELSELPEWLNRGYAGEMKYLHDPRRADPRKVLEGARSLVVVALNYNSAQPYLSTLAFDSDEEAARGWISRYAWGDDYHLVMQEKLEILLAEMRAEIKEPFEARAYVDTGPILERVAAKYAGLGWIAKNTCLINQRRGSWLFLGVIITTLELEPTLSSGEAPPSDLCGSCTRCLDACPTHAFPAPYVLDARRCLSYLTIELRGAIPEEFREEMGNAVFGCDICQDVCPWNRKAPLTSLAAFQPRLVQRAQTESAEVNQQGRSLVAPELEWLASLSAEEFGEIFRKSAVKRTKWRGLVRNACIALGNAGAGRDGPEGARIRELLERLVASDDAVVSEHARWALGQIDKNPANSEPRME